MAEETVSQLHRWFVSGADGLVKKINAISDKHRESKRTVIEPTCWTIFVQTLFIFLVNIHSVHV